MWIRLPPGLSRYIGSIEQEVLVLFDEFDKTFGNIKTGENEAEPQAGLLSLFDGVAPGKKLFVITCNSLRNVSDYLVNRPGRFHYHFRFDYPNADEIRKYMQDNVKQEYAGQIEDVVMFAGRVGLNYDCLRSIAFELNTGLPFKEAIEDLNIVNTEIQHYNFVLQFADGTTLTRNRLPIDLYNCDEVRVEMLDKVNDNILDIRFPMSCCVYDYGSRALLVSGENVSIVYDDDSEEAKRLKSIGISSLRIVLCAEKSIHYAF